MSSTQAALPSGYTELEYIQSTGTQYINTGFMPNGKSKIAMNLTPLSYSSNACFFCARNEASATAGTTYTAFYISSNYYRFDFYGKSGQSDGVDAVGTNINIEASGGVCKIGSKTITNAASTAASSMPWILLASARTSSISDLANMATAKLYSCQIYDNGTLVRNFIPCKNLSGEIGLYDAVNGQFYANAGTGAFTAGPVVVRMPDAPQNLIALSMPKTVFLTWSASANAAGYRISRDGVQIAEIAGTQYIDTDLVQGHTYTVKAYNAHGESSAVSVTAAPGNSMITDRTAADVGARNDKGTYNASDLNRVDACLEYLAARLTGYGYVLPGYQRVEIIRPDIKTVTTETKLVDEPITEDNVDEFFDVTNGTYYFAPSKGVWTSNNGGIKSSTATTTFKAKSAMPVSFDYSYSSEANYDKFTLTVAGTTVENGVSGATTSKSYSGNLAADQTIVLTYSKDSSNDTNDDKCTLSNLKTQVIKTVEVVTTTPDTRDRYTWFEDDIPTPSQMTQYLANVAAIRAAITADTPATPESMANLTYTEANDIEQILIDIDDALTRAAAAWFYSGDLFSGEI